MDNEATGEEAIITVDYGNLPIRCRICLSTEHLARNCPGRIRKAGEGDAVDKGEGGSQSNPIGAEEEPQAREPGTKVLPGPPLIQPGQQPERHISCQDSSGDKQDSRNPTGRQPEDINQQ